MPPAVCATRKPGSEGDFRREVEAFLTATAQRRDAWQYFRDRSGATAELYRELGRRGWLSIAWPEAEGGMGLPPAYEFALWDEMAFARAARPPIAAGLVARSILEYATPAQKQAWLPGIAAGELGFSLGYSEPEAGSDLTGLRTRAHRDGEVYRVTGEKRWTSDAHHADFLWLLCRTGDLASRARGLTLLVVPMSSAGIVITPIDTIDGHRLNEVRLDDVEVPVANRLGEEGEAWSITQAALARERHLQILPGRLRRDLADLVTWARRSSLLARDDVARRLAELTSWLDAVTATAARIVDDVSAGRDTTVAAARQKVVGTALMQQIARLPLEYGDLSQVVEGQPFEFLWRECVLESIAGGTSEVMADIVARRALSLGT
jgi:alkylation response protein AidB-like acyl-CoA dehydrogenase